MQLYCGECVTGKRRDIFTLDELTLHECYTNNMNRLEAEETVQLEAVSHEAKLNFWAY